MIEFRMPSLGADMEDGTLIEWHVEPGARVERGQVVCVVETQKGAIDVEIWEDGTVASLAAAPGDRIPVGQTMAVLAGPGEDWRTIASQAVPLPKAAARAAAPTAVDATPTAPTAAPPAAGQAQAAGGGAGTPGALGTVTAGAAVPGGVPLPPRASPAARRRAAELGVDLAALAGASGGAPITLADIERAASGAPAAAPAGQPEAAAAAPAGASVGAAEAPAPKSPQQAMRDAIAAAMARSKREIPHYYLGAEIEVERSLQWLERFNAGQPVAGRVLFVALVLRAIARALREAPDLNGSFVDGRFRRADAVHLGVVTSLRGGGLVVPRVHDADRLALPELMASLREVLSRARAGQLRSSDLADSTITVSNLGDLGVETVYGIIYPPQVALVGTGRVLARPVVRDGAVVAARTMHVTLSGDHRVSDGLVGARFLSALRERLENPEDR